MTNWKSVNDRLPVEGEIIIALVREGSGDFNVSFAKLDEVDYERWSRGVYGDEGWDFTPMRTDEVLYWRYTNINDELADLFESEEDSAYVKGFKAGEQSAYNKILGLLGKETDNADKQLHT